MTTSTAKLKYTDILANPSAPEHAAILANAHKLMESVMGFRANDVVARYKDALQKQQRGEKGGRDSLPPIRDEYNFIKSLIEGYNATTPEGKNEIALQFSYRFARDLAHGHTAQTSLLAAVVEKDTTSAASAEAMRDFYNRVDRTTAESAGNFITSTISDPMNVLYGAVSAPVGGVAGSVATKVVAPIASKAVQFTAQTSAAGAASGYVGAGAKGAGAEIGHQQLDVAAGVRENVDWDKVKQAANDAGTTGATWGAFLGPVIGWALKGAGHLLSPKPAASVSPPSTAAAPAPSPAATPTPAAARSAPLPPPAPSPGVASPSARAAAPAPSAGPPGHRMGTPDGGGRVPPWQPRMAAAADDGAGTGGGARPSASSPSAAPPAPPAATPPARPAVAPTPASGGGAPPAARLPAPSASSPSAAAPAGGSGGVRAGSGSGGAGGRGPRRGPSGGSLSTSSSYLNVAGTRLSIIRNGNTTEINSADLAKAAERRVVGGMWQRLRGRGTGTIDDTTGALRLGTPESIERQRRILSDTLKKLGVADKNRQNIVANYFREVDGKIVATPEKIVVTANSKAVQFAGMGDKLRARSWESVKTGRLLKAIKERRLANHADQQARLKDAAEVGLTGAKVSAPAKDPAAAKKKWSSLWRWAKGGVILTGLGLVAFPSVRSFFAHTAGGPIATIQKSLGLEVPGIVQDIGDSAEHVFGKLGGAVGGGTTTQRTPEQTASIEAMKTVATGPLAEAMRAAISGAPEPFPSIHAMQQQLSTILSPTSPPPGAGGGGVDAKGMGFQLPSLPQTRAASANDSVLKITNVPVKLTIDGKEISFNVSADGVTFSLQDGSYLDATKGPVLNSVTLVNPKISGLTDPTVDQAKILDALKNGAYVNVPIYEPQSTVGYWGRFFGTDPSWQGQKDNPAFKTILAPGKRADAAPPAAGRAPNTDGVSLATNTGGAGATVAAGGVSEPNPPTAAIQPALTPGAANYG